MRIVAIGGENLASLQGQFHVDFREEPLSNAGLFAITGSTGAGKSTILDALCLSLYNSTPRLSHVKDSTARIRDASGELLTASDPRQTLRRGCVKGCAWSIFVGVDGRQYRAEWRVARAYGKPQGRLGKVEMQLEDLSTGQRLTSGRNTECLQQIAALLQLSYEQFTRAVLLAQGEFSRFLKAKSNEKGELLERLTGTREFSDISLYIHNQSRALRTELQSLEQRLQEIVLPSEEEARKFAEELSNGATQELALTEQLAKEQQKLEARRVLQQLEQSLHEGEVELAECKRKEAQGATSKEGLMLWDEAQSVVDVWHQFLLLARDVKAMEEAGVESAKQIEQAKREFQRVMKMWEDFQRDAKATRIQLEEQRTHLVEAKEQRKSLVALTEQLSRKEEALRLKEVEYKRELAQREQQQKVRQLLVEKLTRGEQFLSCCQSKESIFRLWSGVKPQLEILYGQRVKLTQLKSSVKGNTQRRDQLQLQHEEMSCALDQLLNQLPLEVLKLRASLSEGSPCPVCGSVHHPLAGAQGEGTELGSEAQQKEVEAQRKRLEEMAKELAKLETLVEGQRLHAQQLEVGMAEIRVKIDQSLGDALPGWEAKLLASEQVLNLVTTAVEKWQQQREEVEKCRHELALIDQELAQRSVRIEGFTQELEEKKQEVNAVKQQVQSVEESIGKLLSGKTLERFENDVKSGEETLEKDSKLLDAQREKCLLKVNSLEGEAKGNAEKLADLQRRLDGTKTSINDWLGEHHARFDSVEKLAEVLSGNANEMQRLRKRLDDERLELQRAQSVVQERRVRLDDFLARQPEILPELPILVQLVEERQNALSAQRESNKKLQQLHSQHELLRGQHAKLQEQVDELTPRVRQWQQLDDLYGSYDGAKFRNMAQSYTLDRLLWLANGFLRGIIPRYRIERLPMQEEMGKLSLALQIVDREMLNEVRPADTLSGGESFLVSLALALALSQLSAQGRGIETLFIDEGFGTLDAESLMMALDALERLQSTGLRIGVISHLQELQQRVAVRVVVERGSGGGSSISVRRN